MNDNFGEKLKKARIEKGIKVKEMADIIGVSERAYRNYESGDRDVGTLALKKICSHLKISSAYLLGLSEDMEIAPKITTTCDLDSELTNFDKNIQRITDLFSKLTMIQQENVIARAEMYAEQNSNETETVKVYRAARSGSNHESGMTDISKERLRKLREAPETDEDL